ncbi:MAG: uncharacterized protein PWQ96_837 [Clostridia bacterium]|jgi:hypothetical protein|nr:integrase [Clostridiales bacterium]MDK2985195.1 uncharacterized protein [Clostridia bacterium]
MSFESVLLILATGMLAGFFNTMAGGGSLLTMPVLIFLGLPSAVANGTNRIALLIQNIVAVANFRNKGYFDLKLGLMLGIPALLGSIVGANIAVSLNDELFNKILAIVMLVVLFLILKKPHRKLTSSEEENVTRKQKIASVITFFFIGIYGGFIQAGVGFIIIAALTVLTGMSLVKINSVKVFVILIYMISSLGIFVFNGKVNWILGFTLAIGNSLGAWIGSNFAVKKGDKFIKGILFVAVIAMAAKLLGFF